jgi:cysteine desulfurase
MLPYFTELWGNPSSLYLEAREARRGLDNARMMVAEILGCKTQEIVFTSGGSESDNLAIRGAAYGNRRRGNHIITTAIEHHAVLHTFERLEKEGFTATYLPVDREGFVDLEGLERAITPETVLVSIMYVNNEVGTIEPIAEAAKIIKQRNPHCLFHTDGVQAVGALDINVDRLGVDLFSLTAHKFYGPKGLGALHVRSRTPLIPQILGGSQERDRRAGTENVAGAVGLAKALELAYDEFDQRNAHSRGLRDRLLSEIPNAIPKVRINGPMDGNKRLSNNASFSFEYVEGEAILMALDLAGIAASSGSACTSGSLEPSHVLTAMGVPPDVARGSVRLTVGKDNTGEDIDRLLEVLPNIVARLRSLSPLAGAAEAAKIGTGRG